MNRASFKQYFDYVDLWLYNSIYAHVKNLFKQYRIKLTYFNFLQL